MKQPKYQVKKKQKKNTDLYLFGSRKVRPSIKKKTLSCTRGMAYIKYSWDKSKTKGIYIYK